MRFVVYFLAAGVEHCRIVEADTREDASDKVRKASSDGTVTILEIHGVPNVRDTD